MGGKGGALLTHIVRRQPSLLVVSQKCPRPSQRWCEYFHRQRENLLVIPWERGAELTPAEHELIAPSLREFQQGEGLEGGHFFRCVRAWAEANGDLEYADAHRMFMEEEQRHARDLARFLGLAGIPLLTERSFLNRFFCWCGSRGGLEPTLAIIAQVEIVAQVYYAALRRVTGSSCLRRLCAQILRDEKQHVRFQHERLAILRRERKSLWLMVTHWGDRLLFAGAALACWYGHHRVLRASGLGLAGYWRTAWRAYRAAFPQKDPMSYRKSAVNHTHSAQRRLRCEVSGSRKRCAAHLSLTKR
jgi:hypothetical protein